MEESLSTSEINSYLSSVNSQLKSETIFKAQEYLKEYQITLQDFLGVGSFGVVLKAMDHINNRVVAIKIVVCQDNITATDSLKEFQKMKLLNSQYVISSYEIYYDEDNQAIYIISEFGPNGDLASYYKANKPLPQKRIIQLFNDILEGIRAIHAQNIIHANLKPSNVILSCSHSPKICDFGLSKQLSNKSHILNKGFTPTYTPKEQIEGSIHKESDLYSAGMILCYLCGLEIEENIELSVSMKEGKFPDISNLENKDLFQVAFQMMDSDYLKRITLDEAKQLLINISDTILTHVEQQSSQNETDLKNEVKNGFQKYQYENGEKYEGDFKNDKMNGKGMYFFANGSIYDGEWIENAQTGFGVLKSPDGERYEGYFQDGKYHGEGKIYYVDGNIYQGEWKQNNRNGFGIQLFVNGNRYEGYFKDGKYHGKGKLFFDKGNIYDGEWIENAQTGFGILQYRDGERYEGYFQDGKYHGEGKIYCVDGNIYSGEWKENNRNGFGIQLFVNGNSYEGYFKDGKYHGKGKLFFANGNIYDGEWREDYKDGFGIYQFANGERYEGYFQNDKKNGKGKYHYINGDIYDGEWKDDMRS